MCVSLWKWYKNTHTRSKQQKQPGLEDGFQDANILLPQVPQRLARGVVGEPRLQDAGGLQLQVAALVQVRLHVQRVMVFDNRFNA